MDMERKQKLSVSALNRITNGLKECTETLAFSENQKWFSDYENFQQCNKKCSWTPDKVLTVLKLLATNDDADIKQVMSFLDAPANGWQGDSYKIRNSCFCRDAGHCRSLTIIAASKDHPDFAITKKFEEMWDLLFDDKFGIYFSYILSYCITSAFTSKCAAENTLVPYALQIVCDRNSNVYRLVEEIVEICDINIGYKQNCKQTREYGYCDYTTSIVYPLQSPNGRMEALSERREAPLIVHGFNNQKNYSAILREYANAFSNKRPLSNRDRIKCLPIFISKNATGEYKNILVLNLAGVEIDDNYIDLVMSKKGELSSWMLELVNNPQNYFYQTDSISERVLRTRNPQFPFFDHMKNHGCEVRRIVQQHYGNIDGLPDADVDNVTILSYFLKRFLTVFEQAIHAPANTAFLLHGKPMDNRPRALDIVSQLVIRGMLELHLTYSPRRVASYNVISDIKDTIPKKEIQKEGKRLAKEIIEYYKGCGSPIIISPDIRYEKERFIFSVKMLPGASEGKLRARSDEVRRSANLGLFYLHFDTNSISIIAAQQLPKENGLKEILSSDFFANCKEEIPYVLGYDVLGELCVVDLSKIRHMLIGGASGFGKSVALFTLLLCVVKKCNPNAVKLLLIDLGSSSLNSFDKVPHMLAPTIVDADVAISALSELREVMTRRFEIINSLGIRDREAVISRMPTIICVLDEFPEFIRAANSSKKDKVVLSLISDILDRGRKAKIHFILTAQDSTKDNIQIKKTNIDYAIAFRCNTPAASRSIIDSPEAMQLTGEGTMLVRSSKSQGLLRVQGAYMTSEQIADFFANKEYYDASPDSRRYDDVDFHFSSEERTMKKHSIDKEENRLFQNIISAVCDPFMNGSQPDIISNKRIMKICHVSHDRANLILDELEQKGIVSAPNYPGETKPRKFNRDVAQQYLKSLGYDISGNRILTEKNQDDALIESDFSELSTNISDILDDESDLPSIPTVK